MASFSGRMVVATSASTRMIRWRAMEPTPGPTANSTRAGGYVASIMARVSTGRRACLTEEACGRMERGSSGCRRMARARRLTEAFVD